MYIVMINTGKSQWHYGPFNSKHEATEVANAHKLGNYIVIQLIPLGR